MSAESIYGSRAAQPGAASAESLYGPGANPAAAPAPAAADAAQPPAGDALQVSYAASETLFERLAELGVSLAFTAPRFDTAFLLGRNAEGGLNVHQATVTRATRFCADAAGGDGFPGLTLVAGNQILRYENILQPGQLANGAFDACYAPRNAHFTGFLDVHDAGVEESGRPVLVSARFNCLCAPTSQHSFEPLWRPDFISELADGDRCHLSGVAMQDGAARYVTAASRSNEPDGWRAGRADGGVVIDTQSGKVVAEGLSLPNSPRLRDGELWVLNSGSGELGTVDLKGKSAGTFTARAAFAGFPRGLSFCGEFAAVTVSRPRHGRFEGLALDDRLGAQGADWCGVQIVDLKSGECVEWFGVEGAVTELFDVDFVPGPVCPMGLTPTSDDMDELITFDGMPVPDGPGQA